MNNNKFLSLKLEKEKIHLTFKIVVIGTLAAGKSTFLAKILSGKFFENIKITIGAEIFTKKLKLDNINIKTHIWGLSGSEKYDFQLPFYCLEARGAIIMFDLTRNEEYIKIEKWIKFFRDNAVKDAPFIIVGNKLDLINSTYGLKERKEIRRFAQDLNSPYFEISVKTGHNVKEVFNTIMNLMLEQIKEQNIQTKLPFDFTVQLSEDLITILENKL
jgi:small GTP-binding protein